MAFEDSHDVAIDIAEGIASELGIEMPQFDAEDGDFDEEQEITDEQMKEDIENARGADGKVYL
jgi:hypothetical protein